MPTCPKCGRRVKEGVRFCPFCGQKVESQIQPEVREVRKLLWVLIIGFVALAVVVSTLLLLRSGGEKPEFTLSFVREWNYLENDPTYKAVQYYWKRNYGGPLSSQQEDRLKGLVMARPEIPTGATILDVQVSYLDPERSCGYVTVFYRYPL